MNGTKIVHELRFEWSRLYFSHSGGIIMEMGSKIVDTPTFDNTLCFVVSTPFLYTTIGVIIGDDINCVEQ